MWNLVKPILGGVKSLMPGVTYRHSSGTTSARYCYAVWTRHLAFAHRHGSPVAGATVVELGPGGTLGLSLAALLTGAGQAIALDVLPHASPERNRQVFTDLVALVRDRAPLPGDDEFPDVRPRVPGLRALEQVVDDATLEWALARDRLARIDRDLGRAPTDPGATLIRYVIPWTADAVAPASADLVVSQAVLEYLRHDGRPDASEADRNDELSRAFAAMHRWLRPGGLMSHQVDFTAPFGPEWNAHWAVGDAAWALITARRPHYENRVALSGYLELCARHGFEVLAAEATPSGPGVARGRLAPRFRALPDADYQARGVHLVARKR
jgi:SAM-dependent methyltransferase